VIFPYPLMLPEAAAAVLKEYVNRGGALVAEARLAWNNERGFASERIPGLGLWEVMGARETAIETPPGGRTSIRWASSDLPGLTPGAVLPARWFRETLEPIGPSARVVAHFEDGAAAAVTSTYGKGKTLLLGSYVSASAQSTPTPEAERFFSGLLQWAGVSLPVRLTGAPVEVRYLEAGSEVIAFVFNHSTQPATATVALRLPAAAYRATDLVNGKTVTVTSDAGYVSFAVSLPSSGVQVVRIAR
jgi:beta-galactosidase